MAEKETTGRNEIDDIKNDLNSLKSNVVELTKHIQEDGSSRARKMKKEAQTRIKRAREKSRDQFQELEQQVKEKPGQAVAMAFVAGLVTSLLLSRRS